MTLHWKHEVEVAGLEVDWLVHFELQSILVYVALQN